MIPLRPGDQLDQYRLDALVATGGMGSVFRATDMVTGRPVAIKVPHPEAECDPVFFERFRREAEIGREMDHPGVLKAMPKGSSKRVYMATEWAEGVSLRRMLEREARIPPERVLRIAIALCGTLEYIHARGVVHRDLKPENIMVADDDSIKLLDFGIASKAGARRLTFGKFSRIMGTADYISPEQLQGKRGDARSDLYAVGAVVFEMLTRTTPFDGTNPFMVMRQRLVVKPDLSGIPRELRRILACALAPNPAMRYASARELGEDLAAPEESFNARGKVARHEPGRIWLYSLAIPAGIFLLMLLAALHQ